MASSDNDTTISDSLSYDTISISSDVTSLNSNSNSSSKESSPAHISNTLPSKLDVKKIEWDEIDDLLQVERKDEAQRYSTMPLSLSSSMTDSQISNVSLDTDTSSFKTLSPDGETTSQSSSIYYSQLESSNGKCQDDDELTLKPCDFEDFKRQASRDYMNGANDMPNVNDGTLKYNQPIDPSRINDSLKLYQDNIMSKSVQNEDNLSMYSLSNSFCIPGQINSFNIQDTLNLLKHSSSSSSSDDKTLKHESNKMFKKSISMGQSSSPEDSSLSTDKGISRSKSGPNYALNDFEISDTMKPTGRPATSINIKMDCYDELKAENGSSGSTSTATTPNDEDGTDCVILRKKHKGSTAIKRRSGNRR